MGSLTITSPQVEGEGRTAPARHGTISSVGAPDHLADLSAALDAREATAATVAARGAAPAQFDELLQLLALEAGKGSALAAELLITRLDESGVVRRFARGALLDETSIDDVCQDSLISIAGSVAAFRGGSKVTTWVHSIVRRRVVDHLRRQRATAPLPDDDASPTQRMSSLLATRATVRDALARLPELYREPVVLRDMEGLSYAEVADRLDLPLGTVKGQISRGRALVAAALREGDWDPA